MNCYECEKLGTKCQKCLSNGVLQAIEFQIQNPNKAITILIGNLPARETANLVISALNKHSDIKFVQLKGRGRHIGRTIDVAEILKREVELVESINTGTNSMISSSGNEVNVSEINILLTYTYIAYTEERKYNESQNEHS